MSSFFPYASPFPFVLCLVRPQARHSIAHAYETQSAEANTGIESRSPTREAYRLKVTYDFLLNKVEASELRATFAGLGSTLLALPLWFDEMATASYSANRVYASQYWFSYTGTSIAINAGTYARAAGLVFGRVTSLPELKPAGEGAICRITLAEDSPWDCRISTNPSGSDAFDFTPDWSDLKEKGQWQLRGEEIGDGRQAAVRGEESPYKRGQSARFVMNSRAEIRHLLTFFEARRGTWQSFPGAIWHHPNVGSEELTLRFADDVLTLEYDTLSFAEAKVRVVEQLDLVDGALPQEQPANKHLIRMGFEGGTPNYWTDYEKPLVYATNTYTPKAIVPRNFEQTFKPEGDEIDIVADNFPGNPMRVLVKLELERKLLVTVWECDPANPGDAVQIFDGQILNVRGAGKKLTGRAATMGGIMRRQIPRYQVQTTCNYNLGDDLCGKVLASMEHNGTVDVINGAVVDIITGSSNAADFFAYAWAIFGTGDTAERRAIVRSEPISGGQRLTLSRPLKQTGAIPVTFYPGCDGQASTCRTKFSNLANFGGDEHTPAFMEQVASGFTPKLGK